MSPLDNVIEEIDKLKETTASGGWDSYDAYPVDLGQREEAKQCVRVVGQTIGYALPQPLVSPISDPGVALIWRKKGCGEVDALFTPGGATYLVLSHDRKFVTKGTISTYKSFAADVLARYLK